jgi:RNA polymerase sigma-70 factor (ECF subfamily)
VALQLVEPGPYVHDADVVAGCLRGEASAQRHLFRAHFRHVHATVFRILGGAHEAEDAAQETFAEVFRSLGTFEARAKVATWVDRIAVRVAFRYLRAGKRSGPVPELVHDVPDDAPTADQRTHAREGLRRLYLALDLLPPSARVAFVLHFIDGRSVAETAQLTQSSLVATKVRIWRARRALEAHAASDPILADFVCEGRAEALP